MICSCILEVRKVVNTALLKKKGSCWLRFRAGKSSLAQGSQQPASHGSKLFSNYNRNITLTLLTQLAVQNRNTLYSN